MPKAILIAEDNKEMLLQQYDLEDDQLDGMEGLYLVSEFGESMAIEGILTPGTFNNIYVVTDKKLENGYVDVIRRPLSPA